MYIVFIKVIGRCEVELIANPSWDLLKIDLVKTYGPEFEQAMNQADAWGGLRNGYTVIFHGDMFSLYQEAQHENKHTLFAHEVIIDAGEFDL